MSLRHAATSLICLRGAHAFMLTRAAAVACLLMFAMMPPCRCLRHADMPLLFTRERKVCHMRAVSRAADTLRHVSMPPLDIAFCRHAVSPLPLGIA